VNASAIIVAAFPALLIVGALLAPLLTRRDGWRRSPHGPRSGYDDSGHYQASDRGTPIRMDGSRSASEGAGEDAPAKRDQYFADWAALQARFNEEPA
jgi:hypothetical protein